jgi:hypothetical protein
MTRIAGWPRRALPVVLLAATALFVLGVSLEPDEDAHHDDEGAAAVDGHDREAGESAEHAEGGAHAESDERVAGESGEERVLGLDLESPLLVALAVAAPVGLAALAWFRPDRGWLIVIAVVAAGFALVDGAEVAHQLDEDRTGLALLAGSVTALHVLAAALAARQAASDSPRATVGA